MVLAYKIISGYTIQKQFECGQYDILQESDPGNGWVEISRDCDAWLPARWSLYPYASGNNGGFFSSSNGTVIPEFAKYFANDTDTALTELDLSDINSGVLPANPAARMGVFQNGKKLPFLAYTLDYGLSKILIATDWQVPGASYEVVYRAPEFTP
jgi:hypothetical protein